jgi:SSS family solute:Na+ symporter
VAQRMLASRNENEAMAATLWFNIAHYALRPWPWIIVALASLIIYPELSDIAARFPGLDPSIIRHDLAYPAMLVFVPHGLLGLVVASLAAAYMSTISTHLNWGASYVVDDVYRRFLVPQASEIHYVAVGRLVTVGLMVLAGIVALWLESAMQAFQISVLALVSSSYCAGIGGGSTRGERSPRWSFRSWSRFISTRAMPS